MKNSNQANPGKSYSELLKDPRWQKKRLQIMNRDKFTCKLCGDKETTLNVHHKKYTKDSFPWEYNNDDLITLCEYCHKEVELLKHEGGCFSDIIEIFKEKSNDQEKYLLVISLDQKCIIRIYDNNRNMLSSGTFMGNIIVKMIELFKKSLSNG